MSKVLMVAGDSSFNRWLKDKLTYVCLLEEADVDFVSPKRCFELESDGISHSHFCILVIEEPGWTEQQRSKVVRGCRAHCPDAVFVWGLPIFTTLQPGLLPEGSYVCKIELAEIGEILDELIDARNPQEVFPPHIEAHLAELEAEADVFERELCGPLEAQLDTLRALKWVADNSDPDAEIN